MTESEVKITIEEIGYLKVLEYFDSSLKATQNQWNVYFDTVDFDLRKSRRNLRLRSVRAGKEPTKWIVTVKRPGVFRNGIAIRPERNYEIPNEIAQEILAHPCDIMKNIPKKARKYLKDCVDWKFRIVGDYITIRRVISFEDLTIEADETILPNKEKLYELEIECDEPQIAKQKMKEINVRYVNSSVSKLGFLLNLRSSQRTSRVFSEL
ncbi:Adenylate cyclase family protein [Tritrichomonas foetus]|uniref:Adenylate cyclase family protein n=1 Tax=Tritrichomonas foetus TaxID=1144522 RepID=A0A1J4KBN1_9EUKA|nr:Adenylate cyclase family protein [Tritrichomonas foetus]|eukprot:OHT08312.1 Adenylate cyclase family protein [Tritrichomonas foetus]